MQEIIAKLEKKRDKIKQGAGLNALELQHKKGKLSARERVEKLLDPGTFFEIDLFSKPVTTTFSVDEKTIRGDGLVAGYGEVNGRALCVWSQDATILGGTVGTIHGVKMVKTLKRALKNRIPCVGIIDSDGLRVEDVITTPTKYSFDHYMYTQTLASGVIPQISLIMGQCKGPAAISAQLSDFIFMVKNTSYSCVCVDEDKNEMRKTTAAMHFKNSGCCDVLADNDAQCIEKARELLNLLPLNNKTKAPFKDTQDDLLREVPELMDIVPVNSRKGFLANDFIKAIADNGYFFEIKGGWAKNLVVGYSRFAGKPAGIIASNPRIKAGCMDVNSADKLTRFVRFCDAFNIPVVYLADTPAFLPAVKQERNAIIRHGAKVVFTNRVASVPQMQIYIRKCYGGGNLAMPGSNLEGDLGLAWPAAEIMLMNPEGAVSIIYRKEIAGAENPKEEYKKRVENFKAKGASENVWEAMSPQDYIEPKDTRIKIIKSLKFIEGKTEETHWKKHDNMPL